VLEEGRQVRQGADLGVYLTDLGVYLISFRGTSQPQMRLLEFVFYVGRIWRSEATRLEDPLGISNGMWALKSSGERNGVLSLV
jgi:hypothetical protein